MKNNFKYATDEEIDKMTDDERYEYIGAMTAANPPTAADLKRWNEMAQEMVDNLNRNVGESMKRSKGDDAN